MGLFGIGKKFNNNSYGIDKKTEWKGENGIKEELKKTGLFTKRDIKEIKKAIKNDQLSAYMDNMSIEMQNALGLSLSKRIGVDRDENLAELAEFRNLNVSDVPKEDVAAALKVLEQVNVAGADKSIVKAHIYAALHPETAENVETSLREFDELLPA